MAAKKKETDETQIDETQVSPPEDTNPDDLSETLVSELKEPAEDDLEAQMAAAMAAESLSSTTNEEDDLEAQMAAAMSEEKQGDENEEDLEAQMLAAMEKDSKNFDSIPGDRDYTPSVKKVDFRQLAPSDEMLPKDSIDRLMDVGLTVSVELGRKDMKIREVLSLGPGKIIELDKLAGEPVDLLVNGKLLAKGEVVVVDENFGVRVTELIDPVDRIKILK
jgi:flagellar motor switch protein FliN